MKDKKKEYIYPKDFLDGKKPYVPEEFGYDEQFNDVREEDNEVNINQCLQLN